jgi:hypothetical protein
MTSDPESKAQLTLTRRAQESGASIRTATKVKSGTLVSLLSGVIGVLIAVCWALAGQALLQTAARHQDERALEQATALLDFRLDQVAMRLKTECRLIGDDPRLRSALGTHGIDENTIADILTDIQKLTGAELEAVLAPTGRVGAVVGQTALRGVDLSTSKAFREARDSNAPVTGYWVIGQRLFQVGAFAIRYGDRAVGYLIHGYPVDENVLGAVYSATQVGVAIASATAISRAVPDDPAYHQAFSRAIESPASGTMRVGQGKSNFLARIRQVEGALPPIYFIWLRAPVEAPVEHEILGYLLWAPTLVALALAILFVRRRA